MYLSLTSLLLLAVNMSGPHPPAHSARPAPPPVVGSWQLVGTAPPGFVRHGAQVAQLTLTMRGKSLQALVLTGTHRYAATAQYVAARKELTLQVPTSSGRVRLDATLAASATRMVGTWYDAHGDDGGFVLVRLTQTRKRT